MARAATNTKPKTETPTAEMADGSTAGKELTVSNGAPPARAQGPKTVQQERKEKLEALVAAIEKRADDYRPFLDVQNIPWKVFVAVIKQALVRNSDLLGCSAASVLDAALRCAKDGLMPDGKDAAIVPFKTTATYMPMYQGLLKVAYGVRDGVGAMVFRDVNAEVIYAGEEPLFDYVAGTEPKIMFRPALNRDTSKKIVGAFSVIRTNNGGCFVEVVPEMELAKIAAVGKAGGPRKAWAGEFAKKDALRRNLKTAPKDDRLRQVLSHDEDSYLKAEEVDGDDTAAIPDDKLFDDTAHQVEDLRGPTDAQDRQEAQDRVSAAQAQARQDLMESDTEEKLEATIAKIEDARGFFGDEITDALLENAEQLRLARFGGTQSGEGEVDDDADAEGLSGISEAQDRLDAEVAARPPADADADAKPAEPSGSEPTPNAPASASSEESAKPAGTATTASRSEWPDAPAERRVTPGAILLADPEEGLHYKAGIAPNANGQVPIFNRLDEIVCWAKGDMDLPTVDGAFPQQASAESKAPSPADVHSNPPESNTSAEPVKEADTSAPDIRANPEDRQEPAGTVGDDDDGYGEEAAQPVYRIKAHPAKPPKEYADPVEWRDAIIFKMSSLSDVSIQKWWVDNREFVEAAISTARAPAGKVIVQAVVRKLPGAKEIVDQHGPFQ